VRSEVHSDANTEFIVEPPGHDALVDVFQVTEMVGNMFLGSQGPITVRPSMFLNCQENIRKFGPVPAHGLKSFLGNKIDPRAQTGDSGPVESAAFVLVRAEIRVLIGDRIAHGSAIFKGITLTIPYISPPVPAGP